MSIKNIFNKIDQFDKKYQKINKQYNCFTNNISDFGRKHIDDADGLLKGKLIAIKDNINIKDYPTTCSSKILDNHISLYNATVINRLINEKGIIVAKSNMDEFAMGSSTEYSSHGVVSNPRDVKKVAGGSSGGSAAAVACKAVDIALGSDTGGSVRQPAAFCGVYGLKPTYGKISRYGLTAFASSLDQIGIFANNTDDIANTLLSIGGLDANDSNTIDESIILNYNEKDITNLKIGFSKKLINELPSEMSKKYFNVINFLKDKDVSVENVDIDLLDLAIPTYYIIATAEASSNLSRFDGIRYGKRISSNNIEEIFSNTRSQLLGDEVKRRIMLGTYVLSSGYYDDYYNKALKVRNIITKSLIKHFLKFDALLLPTTPTTAFSKNEKKDNPLEMYLSDIYTIPMSLSGIPSMSIPIGNVDKLPLGMQICSNYSQENTIFLISKFLEDNFLKG
ncbi:MAG: glutaminyl-tRNA synthase (glutamine-hydrolyzing) subunit A [bacterium TMED6]|nr:MAG: glutaminyl-tRNA synthase (glutamine-hydrolyzing) subunit A [bacterium TMED6]|tara:strand:- start:15771 stop:17123 length:1353 start_codon:yes stop_codon:yes gene_type:complete